jgi:hypothetical protein
MELTLNLAWLILTLATFVLFRRRLLGSWRSPRPGVSKWNCLVALCCVLVILFFVISVTDDLHDAQVFSEESQSSRLLPSLLQTFDGKNIHHATLSPALYTDPVQYDLAHLCVGRVELLSSPTARLLRTAPLFGRAPPPVSA